MVQLYALQTGEEQPLYAVCCEDHVVATPWGAARAADFSRPTFERALTLVDHVCNTLIALMESFPGTLGFLTALAWARMRAAPSPANTDLCSRGDCGCDNAFDFRGNASPRVGANASQTMLHCASL